MKFIILESKLKKFQFSYLDSLTSVSKSDSFIIVWGNDYGNEANTELLMEYDYYDGRLFVDGEFYNKFKSFFGGDFVNPCKVISKWFEKRFEVEVEFCES
jgi:hypothetical protein